MNAIRGDELDRPIRVADNRHYFSPVVVDSENKIWWYTYGEGYNEPMYTKQNQQYLDMAVVDDVDDENSQVKEYVPLYLHVHIPSSFDGLVSPPTITQPLAVEAR